MICTEFIAVTAGNSSSVRYEAVTSSHCGVVSVDWCRAHKRDANGGKSKKNGLEVHCFLWEKKKKGASSRLV
jgi:hypothetical protein